MGGLGVHPGMILAVSAIEYVAERVAVEVAYLEAFNGEFEKSHV